MARRLPSEKQAHLVLSALCCELVLQLCQRWGGLSSRGVILEKPHEPRGELSRRRLLQLRRELSHLRRALSRLCCELGNVVIQDVQLPRCYGEEGIGICHLCLMHTHKDCLVCLQLLYLHHT